MLTIEGLEDLMPTLKCGSEMESTLHYANSDDDPWRRSLHSIVFHWINSVIGVFPSDVISCILTMYDYDIDWNMIIWWNQFLVSSYYNSLCGIFPLWKIEDVSLAGGGGRKVVGLVSPDDGAEHGMYVMLTLLLPCCSRPYNSFSASIANWNNWLTMLNSL